MGRLKDHDEITWDDSTDRTVYKWTEMSNTVEGASKPRTSCQLAQSAIRSDGKQEKGKLSNDKKWCEDHITRTQVLPREFSQAQQGSSFSDFHRRQVREGERRDEWLEKTSVRSTDKRRALQWITYSSPTNSWLHMISKGKESDEYDLCRQVRISGYQLWSDGKYMTDEALPIQCIDHAGRSFCLFCLDLLIFCLDFLIHRIPYSLEQQGSLHSTEGINNTSPLSVTIFFIPSLFLNIPTS